MEVLVVGGTGLISTGITRELVADGHDVTCYTRGETGADVPDSVAFVHGDRTDPDGFAADVADLDVDCVVDVVCFDGETAGRAVEAFAGEVEQYVFCSTVDVYRRPPATNPVTEAAPRAPPADGAADDPTRSERSPTPRERVQPRPERGFGERGPDDATPVSEYAAGKADAEDVFLAAHERDDFAATVLRPWSTYGEGGTVLHTLGTGTYYVDRICRGKPILVHGDGQSLWGPCHRDDVARAFANAVGNEAAYGEAYHVTSEEVITWNQYHETVARALDAPEPELVHVPTDLLSRAAPERTAMLRDHFQFSTVFENARARRDLDFEYTVAFEEGVRRTVERLESEGRIDRWDSEDDDALVAAWRDASRDFLDAVDAPGAGRD